MRVPLLTNSAAQAHKPTAPYVLGAGGRASLPPAIAGPCAVGASRAERAATDMSSSGHDDPCEMEGNVSGRGTPLTFPENYVRPLEVHTPVAPHRPALENSAPTDRLASIVTNFLDRMEPMTSTVLVP